MALKIRLRQQGRNNRQFFRVVVADVRSPRDGKCIETLGWYNPIEAQDDKNLFVKADRIQHWLNNGAQVSECVADLLGRALPAVMKQRQEKALALLAKKATKRKARSKKAAAAKK